jgi:hypothetical protein
MLRRMTGHTRLWRFLALSWAALQLAAPAVSSLADARLAAAGNAIAHVEASSSDTCPLAHSPDCAMCRYLSGAASPADASPAPAVHGGAAAMPIDAGRDAGRVAVILPDCRAPPTA